MLRGKTKQKISINQPGRKGRDHPFWSPVLGCLRLLPGVMALLWLNPSMVSQWLFPDTQAFRHSRGTLKDLDSHLHCKSSFSSLLLCSHFAGRSSNTLNNFLPWAFHMLLLPLETFCLPFTKLNLSHLLDFQMKHHMKRAYLTIPSPIFFVALLVRTPNGFLNW